MTRAAIYARRSTDELQVDSIPAQLDFAKRFTQKRGFDVVLVETDTASGAEWALRRRPGIYRIREAALRGDFDVLIARDDSRIGRDMLRMPLLVQELSEAGVRVVFYSTGEELKIEAGTDRLIATIRAYSAEAERLGTSSKTRDALERRAREGLVAGGKVYGYRNVRDAGGPKAPVRRVIDEREAAVVRELFTRYVDGEGLKALAKRLNARKEPSPRGGASWAPSGITTMLRRELYAGRVVWGHVEKSYKGGTRVRSKRHARELVHLEVPELRLVEPELWEAAQARRQARGGAPRRSGRPERYLLSGILRCAECGGPLNVSPGKRSGIPIRVYCCARHRERGTCASTLRREVGIVDRVLLEWIGREVLKEELLAEVLVELRQRLASRATEQRAETAQLAHDVERARGELDRLVDAAAGAPPEARGPFYARVSERTRELAVLEDRLRATRTVPPALDLEVRRLEREARARLEELKAGLPDLAPAEARAIVELVFPGGIRASAEEGPDGKRMRLVGEASVGGLLGLDVDDGRCGNTASPAGSETIGLVVVA